MAHTVPNPSICCTYIASFSYKAADESVKQNEDQMRIIHLLAATMNSIFCMPNMSMLSY